MPLHGSGDTMGHHGKGMSVWGFIIIHYPLSINLKLLGFR